MRPQLWAFTNNEKFFILFHPSFFYIIKKTFSSRLPIQISKYSVELLLSFRFEGFFLPEKLLNWKGNNENINKALLGTDKKNE